MSIYWNFPSGWNTKRTHEHIERMQTVSATIHRRGTRNVTNASKSCEFVRTESRSLQRTLDISYIFRHSLFYIIIIIIIMGRCGVRVDATGKCVNNFGVYWNVQFYKWLSGRLRCTSPVKPTAVLPHCCRCCIRVVVSSSFSMNVAMRQCHNVRCGGSLAGA